MPKKFSKTLPDPEAIEKKPRKKHSKRSPKKKIPVRRHESIKEQPPESIPYGLPETKRVFIMWGLVITVMIFVIIAWSVSWKIQLANQEPATDKSWQERQANLNIILKQLKKNTAPAENYLRNINEPANINSETNKTLTNEEIETLKKALEQSTSPDTINLNIDTNQ